MASLIPAGSQSLVAAFVPDVYRAYTAFAAAAAANGRTDLAHQLVLCEPLSIAGEAPLVAAGIASAASLCIEPDPASIRAGIRGGSIDFTVTNLDEALRALKNEIRKGLSIAVCLEGDPQQIRSQMKERGVQPEFVCASAQSADAHEIFVNRGAQVLDPAGHPLPYGFSSATWRVSALPGKWLPRIDAAVAAVLSEEDQVRRSWLKRAPRYLGRVMRMLRYLPLSTEEYQAASLSLLSQIMAENWDVAITLEHDGRVQSLNS